MLDGKKEGRAIFCMEMEGLILWKVRQIQLGDVRGLLAEVCLEAWFLGYCGARQLRGYREAARDQWVAFKGTPYKYPRSAIGKGHT